MIKTGLIILLVLVVISFSCDAPKNNPLHSGANITPVVTEFNVYSVVQDRYTISKLYQVIVKAKILDRNDMVDSVFIDIPYFKVRKPLEFNVQNHVYERTLTLKDMNTSKPNEIEGQVFKILIKDIASRLSEGKEDILRRVIKDDLSIESPLGGDTTESSPVLKWKEFNGGFTHNFFVQVYTYEILPQLVWQKENIPPDSLSVKVDVPLPKGDYTWYVWCIDLFNDRASSKPATFKVQ